MTHTFDQLVRFARPYPVLASGFAACTYALRFIEIDQALSMITCWDKVTSIRDCTLMDQSEKIERYSKEFPFGPVIAIAFELQTFARIWSDEYGGRSGDDLVVFEGNHRLRALALRRDRGVKDDHLIGVFVGRVDGV